MPSADTSSARTTFMVAVIALIVLVLIGVVSLMPLDPFTTHSGYTLQNPSVRFWLGTDELGRDILSRVVIGLRNSVALSLSAVLSSAIIGTALAVVAVSFGRTTRVVTAFVSDAVLALPIIVICLVLTASFGGSARVVFAGQAAAFIPLVMRVSMGELTHVMNQDFARTSLGFGLHPARVALRHGIAFLLPKLCSQCISLLAIAIGIEGGLSYFGLGIPVPIPGLGSLLNNARGYISVMPLYFFTVMGMFFTLLLSLALINFFLFQRRILISGSPYAPTNYIIKKDAYVKDY